MPHETTFSSNTLTSLEKFLLGLAFVFGICTFAIALTLALNTRSPPKEPCRISIKDFENSVPVILKNGNVELLYPIEGEIIIEDGGFVDVACPGSYFVGEKGSSTAVLKCEKSQFLSAESKQVNAKTYQCEKTVLSTARPTGKTCPDANTTIEIEIGFEISTSQFLRQIEICFDTINYNTLYAHSTIEQNIAQRDTGVPRPEFTQDNFYNQLINLADLYIRTTQKKTVNTQLGLKEDDTSVIDDKGDNFFSRGHLVAKADFFYDYQQNATFHYVNTAPQWQFLNGRNWEIIESDVRQYATDKQVQLEVYTGTHGILKLKHSTTSEDVELYLFYTNETARSLPIPEVFWKIVYNKNTKAGIAIVGVNKLSNDVTEVCKKINSEWLHINNTENAGGDAYACDVNDLRKIVKTAPNLEVTSVLK